MQASKAVYLHHLHTFTILHFLSHIYTHTHTYKSLLSRPSCRRHSVSVAAAALLSRLLQSYFFIHTSHKHLSMIQHLRLLLLFSQAAAASAPAALPPLDLLFIPVPMIPQPNIQNLFRYQSQHPTLSYVPLSIRRWDRTSRRGVFSSSPAAV